MLSNHLVELQCYIPAEFARKCREVFIVLRWKATEFRLFMLYVGPVVLKNILSKQKYVHFLEFHCAMRILLNPNLCKEQEFRQFAKDILKHFVQSTKILYDKNFIAHNFHNNIHIADDADYFIDKLVNFSLDTISAFPFENYMQSIKRKVRARNRPLEQIGRRLGEIMSFESENPSKPQDHVFPKLFSPHNAGPVLPGCRSQYRGVALPLFKITNNAPDNCCGTADGVIIQVANVAFSDHLQVPVVIGREFVSKRDFYNVPIESSRNFRMTMKESEESGKGSSSVASHKETSPSCKELCDKIKKVWAIVEFDTLEEQDLEGFIDLVPSGWITSGKRFSWYPMSYHKSSIEKLAKMCGEVDPKWDCFPMTIIEDGIDNYNKGMKMLVKISKNPNSTLYSDVEEKGKGRRKKKPNKRFDNFIDDTEDYAVMKKKAQSVVPSIPKLASFRVPTKNARLPCKEKITQQLPFVENRREPVTTISPASINKENIGYIYNKKGCKMHPNAMHKCAYTSDGEVTLQSLADAVCFFGNQLSSCKLMLKITEKTINSFVESELLNNKSAPKEQPLPKKHSKALMDTFPLLTMDEFKAIEKKLKNDDTYRSRLIESLRGEVVGDTLQKRINSVLRIIFDDKLASLFNWKGQRGEKQKLNGHRINKVMIEIVAEKFPKINETIFGRKAGTWLSQAPSRIQKKKCNNNEEEDMESDNDCDADRCKNNGDDEEKYTKSDDDDDANKSSDASKSENEEMDP